MKVAVAPESVPRLGARAALEIPLMGVEVHHQRAAVVGHSDAERPQHLIVWPVMPGAGFLALRVQVDVAKESGKQVRS